MGFGPVNVGLWRMAGRWEVGDHERAVAIAEGLRPEVHPNRPRRAAYWLDYGRALARVRGRRASMSETASRGAPQEVSRPSIWLIEDVAPSTTPMSSTCCSASADS
jgi:hypothetical protein